MLLPGPPHEIKALFDEQCMDRLRAKLPPQFMATRVLKIGLMAESQADARVAPIYKRYTDVQTTILAGAGEIQLHLKTRARVARRRATARRPAGGRNRRRTRRRGVLRQRRFARADRRLLPADAQRHAGGGRVLHRRPAGGAHHFGQWQLALLSGWSGGLFQQFEDGFCRCSRRH